MQIDRPITIAVTIFVIILLIFFFTLPEYNTFRGLQTQYIEKKAEADAQHVYYAEISKTYFDLKSKQEDVKKIDDALPQDPTLGKLIYFLQKTAKDNGLVVKDLFLSKSSASAVTTDTSNSIKDIVFSIDLMGDYPSLGNFIISTEKSARIFEVTTITFNSIAASPIQSFSLQIKTHSY